MFSETFLMKTKSLVTENIEYGQGHDSISLC